MTLRQYARNSWRDFKRGVITPIALAGAIQLVPTIALNAVAIPFLAGYNGLERAVGGQVKHETARLEEKGETPMINGGFMRWGKFAFESGRVETLYDTCDIVSGKFLPNRQIAGARVGESYKVTSLEGPLSYKLITLEK